MSVTINSGSAQLIGDGFGENWARKQLKAAPATAKKMQFVYRAWFDTVSATLADSSAPWDSCAFLGLGFDNTMFEFDTPFTSFTADDFLGVCNAWPVNSASSGLGTSLPNDKTLSFFNATRGPEAVNGAYDNAGQYQKVAFWDGVGNEEFSVTQLANNQASELLSFASSPSEGAQITHMWEVFSGNTDNTVYLRAYKDNASVAEGDAMFAVMDGKTEGASAGNVYKAAIHGDVTSNWINADGTMNFPRWFKFKHTYKSQSFVVKYFKIRYLDINDNVIT